jgi:PAS domain S-box-containing protein
MGAFFIAAPLANATPQVPMRKTPQGVDTWRMRSHLALLVAACVLPCALLSAGLIMVQYEQSRTRAMREVISLARATAASLDRDLASITAGLQVLATSGALGRDDLSAFYLQAQAALPFQNITNHVLIDPQGAQVLNTLRPWGSPLPVAGGAPSLQTVFRTRSPHLTDLFTGPVTGRPILALGVPVVREGQVAYALNAGIFPERFMGVLQAQHMPPGWICAVLDSQGRVVARNRDMARYVGKLAVPSLVKAVREQSEGLIETVSLDGIPVVTAYSHSSVSRWSVAVGLPQAELTHELKVAMAWLLLCTTALYGALLWLVWRLALKRVEQPAQQLLAHMRLMAQGQAPNEPPLLHAPREIVELAQGFADMSAQLRERDREREHVLHRLSTTLESIHDSFFLLDEHWYIVHVNQRAESLLSLPSGTLIGQRLWQLLDERDTLALRATFEQAVRQQQALHVEAQLPGLGVWLEVHLYPSELGLSVYAQDTSGQRQVREAQAARRVAEASNRAKTEFLSRMSHELRTPLNAVLGFAQVLQLDTAEPLTPRQRGMLDHIEASGSHLLAMISDVLDVSRIESGGVQLKHERMAVHDLVQHCTRMVAAPAQAAQVQLVTHADPDVHWVWADHTSLTQVLLNLLSNAIKYNQPGGTVSLITQQQEGRVAFKVEDTGLGLSAEQMGQLYEPFNRLGRETTGLPGTGIGLVICQRLVTLMGGELEVQSVEGEGSVFGFSLPVPPPSSAPG